MPWSPVISRVPSLLLRQSRFDRFVQPLTEIDDNLLQLLMVSEVSAVQLLAVRAVKPLHHVAESDVTAVLLKFNVVRESWAQVKLLSLGHVETSKVVSAL